MVGFSSLAPEANTLPSRPGSESAISAMERHVNVWACGRRPLSRLWNEDPAAHLSQMACGMAGRPTTSLSVAQPGHYAGMYWIGFQLRRPWMPGTGGREPPPPLPPRTPRSASRPSGIEQAPRAQETKTIIEGTHQVTMR